MKKMLLGLVFGAGVAAGALLSSGSLTGCATAGVAHVESSFMTVNLRDRVVLVTLTEAAKPGFKLISMADPDGAHVTIRAVVREDKQ